MRSFIFPWDLTDLHDELGLLMRFLEGVIDDVAVNVVES